MVNVTLIPKIGQIDNVTYRFIRWPKYLQIFWGAAILIPFTRNRVIILEKFESQDIRRHQLWHVNQFITWGRNPLSYFLKHALIRLRYMTPNPWWHRFEWGAYQEQWPGLTAEAIIRYKNKTTSVNSK